MLYTPNNILYKYIRYRFRRIQIQCNMLYDIAPEEEDEICRNLLKKRAKILIPAGILYFLLFGVIFAWLVGTSEELNPLMQWELRVIDYVIPILNTIDIKWYAYPLDLLWGSNYISAYSDYKCISLYHFFLYCRYHINTT